MWLIFLRVHSMTLYHRAHRHLNSFQIDTYVTHSKTTLLMLNHLSIKNFAIASEIEIDLNAGMTVLTGETGAGKSILLGALGLALGDRADSGMVRHGEKKAEICASFDVKEIPSAQAWLEAHDLDSDEECILRRVITAEGRSKAYINGQPSPLSDIKALGEQMIDIHSQHEHQSLLVKEKHRNLLDDYAGHDALTKEVMAHFQAWQAKAKHFEMLINNREETEARLQVLNFQVDEFDTLSLQEGEIEQLEQEQAKLGNAEALIQSAHEALGSISDDEHGAGALIQRAKNALSHLPSEDPTLSEALALFEEASIQVEEASNTLRSYVDDFEQDPTRLEFIEERLSTAYQLARKHRCQPETLNDVHRKLAEELNALSGGDQNLSSLEQEVGQLKDNFLERANALRDSRMKHAISLEETVAEQLQMMSMQNVRFVTQIDQHEERNANIHGIDDIEFLISTNPGQPPRALGKIASGGELSRISLAIQVVLAQRSAVPSMIFDEVDVGIGGSTAEVVGRLLKELGKNGQVMCITHQAQVASQGEHHLRISKSIMDGTMHSSVDPLNDEERTEEVARMLGGIDITDQTKAHAREMLKLK
jgi:DNA repair protein RecN (Recombination protein N)